MRAKTMEIIVTDILETVDEHRARCSELKESAQSEINRRAAEYHRGYADAMEEIARGWYEVIR